MNPPSNTTEPKTKMERLFKWLENQGVSTVLLLLGAVGIWKMGPEIIRENREATQKGYERIQEMHTKEADAYKDSVERVMRYVEKQEGLSTNVP